MKNLTVLMMCLAACDAATMQEPSDEPMVTETPEPVTPSEEPREDCPLPGRGMVEVSFEDADPGITAADELSFVLFEAFGGPPSFFLTAAGADVGSLPYTLIDNNIPPGTYQLTSFCFDAGTDSRNTCEEPGDVLLLLQAPLVIEANRVTSVSADFVTETSGPGTVVDADPTCP